MHIQEVVVVEGKTDTQKLKSIFGPEIQTIETNGLNVNAQLLKTLEAINENRGIIILTDPDGPGQKIREQINAYFKTPIKNAFISRPLIKTRAKIGVAEADALEIKSALENVITFNTTNQAKITWEEYLKNDLYLPENRKLIAQHFNWSLKINSKTLFNWIQYSGFELNQLLKITRQED